MADIPNTRLFNFVATPASVHYDQFGNAEVLLDPGGIIDVSGFRKMSLLIVSARTNSFSVFEVSIGKISNATAAEEFSQPVDGHTHTFEVVGQK